MHFDPAANRTMLADITRPARIKGMRGPWLTLLNQVLALAGPEARFERHVEKAWSSATFSGARHTIVLHFAGEDGIARGEALIAALPDHEFAIPGRLVADAAIIAVDHRQEGPAAAMTVEAELLLLDEA